MAEFHQKRNRTSKRNQGWAQWAAALVAQVMAPPKSSRLQIDWRRPGPMLKYDTPPPSREGVGEHPTRLDAGGEASVLERPAVHLEGRDQRAVGSDVPQDLVETHQPVEDAACELRVAAWASHWDPVAELALEIGAVTELQRRQDRGVDSELSGAQVVL